MDKVMPQQPLIGFAGQTRVLIAVGESNDFIDFTGCHEGEEFEFTLHHEDCKKLVAHINYIMDMFKSNQER